MTQTMTKRRFVTVIGTGLLVTSAGCGGRADPPRTDVDDEAGVEETTTASAEPSPTLERATPTDAPDASPGRTEIRMVTDNLGSYFDPKGLLIGSGTTVRFVNDSGVHGTTAYHPDLDDRPLRIPEDAEPWDSGLYTAEGETFDVTFDVAGVFDYYCLPHESLGMVGRIVVDEPRDGPATTPIDELPPAAREKMPSVGSILENGTVPGP